MANRNPGHSLLMGYVLWISGFTGSRRFYYGRPVSGTSDLFTLGLLLIGSLFCFRLPSSRTAAGRSIH